MTKPQPKKRTTEKGARQMMKTKEPLNEQIVFSFTKNEYAFKHKRTAAWLGEGELRIMLAAIEARKVQDNLKTKKKEEN